MTSEVLVRHLVVHLYPTTTIPNPTQSAGILKALKLAEGQNLPDCILVPVLLNPCTFKPGSVAQTPSSTLTSEHAWTHPPSSTPDYLTEAVRVKRADLRRSGSHGEHAPGDKARRAERKASSN